MALPTEPCLPGAIASPSWASGASGTRHGALLWPAAAPWLMGAASEGAGTATWLFGTVALGLVALLAFKLGWLAAGSSRPPAEWVPSPGAAPPWVAACSGRMRVLTRSAAADPGQKTAGPWLAVDVPFIEDRAAHDRQEADRRPAAAVLPPSLPEVVAQQAQAMTAGSELATQGWLLRCWREGPQEWLIAWPSDPQAASVEQARKAQNAQEAHEAQQVQEAQALSFSVSHDLRAPVRVVEGFTRILKEDYGRQLDRIGNDHLDRVMGAAARMNAMIEGMLALARLSTQPLSRQPVDLSRLAGFVVEDLRRLWPQRSVLAQIEPGLEVMADPTLMRQLMENLLSNAWKYSSRTDQACISVRSLTDADGRRVIEVGDNGAGFDMRNAERLFGLFQRLHAAHDFPGTGVGLASVQRIVRRHGGEVWADSAPGQGARFRFTLG